MERQIAGLVGSIGGVVVLLTIAVWWIVAMAVPFMLLSVAKSLRRIATQLERPTNTPTYVMANAAPEIGPWRPRPAGESLGHQLLK